MSLSEVQLKITNLFNPPKGVEKLSEKEISTRLTKILWDYGQEKYNKGQVNSSFRREHHIGVN